MVVMSHGCTDLSTGDANLMEYVTLYVATSSICRHKRYWYRAQEVPCAASVESAATRCRMGDTHTTCDVGGPQMGGMGQGPVAWACTRLVCWCVRYTTHEAAVYALHTRMLCNETNEADIRCRQCDACDAM